MSGCPELNYSNVSLAAWEAAKVEVMSQYGVSITDNIGTANHEGFSIAWTYAAFRLSLQCTSSPWFLSCGMINSAIDSLVKKVLAANPWSMDVPAA